MKLLRNMVASSLLVLAHTSFSQGFINLDFESAFIVPIADSLYYPYAVAVTNALPGWTVTGYSSSNATDWITYNDPFLGSSWVNLWATNGQQISGNFSLLLQGGVASGASISQAGMVPAGTESLLFEAQRYGFNAGGILLVSLGGQNIPFIALSTSPNYTLYGADISAFAGQTEQLIFSALGQASSGIYPNNWTVDNIQFSSSPVPEPSELALAALGAMLVVVRRWRSQ